MKYKRILLLLLGFLIFATSLKAQSPVFTIRENNFPFAFREKYFVLTPDTLYSSNDGILWEAEANTFGIRQMQLSFVEDQSAGYIFHESGGKIINYNGSRFSVYHNSAEYRNQYGSLPFLYNKNPHIFGGFGLFTHKNIIAGYDKLQMDWVKVQTKTPINSLPQPRFNLCGGYIGENLFVGPGLGVDETRDNSESHQIQLNDFWRFNFITKEWSMLGTLKKSIDIRRYLRINNYKEGTLLLGLTDAYYMDMRANRLYRYTSVDGSMLAETANNFSVPSSVAYNANTDKFIVLVLKSDDYRMPLVVNAERLLGVEVEESKLYVTLFPFKMVISIIVILIASVLLIYFKWGRRRMVKSYFEKISDSMAKIEEQMTAEEFSILKMIVAKHPQPVQFLDLMSIFDPKMSYESHKKRLRSTLLSIDEKLKKHLHTNADVFDIARSKEDRRNKEIKFLQ